MINRLGVEKSRDSVKEKVSFYIINALLILLLDEVIQHAYKDNNTLISKLHNLNCICTGTILSFNVDSGVTIVLFKK